MPLFSSSKADSKAKAPAEDPKGSKNGSINAAPANQPKQNPLQKPAPIVQPSSGSNASVSQSYITTSNSALNTQQSGINNAQNSNIKAKVFPQVLSSDKSSASGKSSGSSSSEVDNLIKSLQKATDMDIVKTNSAANELRKSVPLSPFSSKPVDVQTTSVDTAQKVEEPNSRTRAVSNVLQRPALASVPESRANSLKVETITAPAIKVDNDITGQLDEFEASINSLTQIVQSLDIPAQDTPKNANESVSNGNQTGARVVVPSTKLKVEDVRTGKPSISVAKIDRISEHTVITLNEPGMFELTETWFSEEFPDPRYNKLRKVIFDLVEDQINYPLVPPQNLLALSQDSRDMSYSTSTNASVAANEMLGTIKEKATLAMVYFTDVERSIVKATNRDIVVPKQKHVQIILSATVDRSINLIDLFKTLQGRLQVQTWQVAFKALLVLHYLILEGNAERVMGYLSSHPGIFNMTNYRDSGSGGQGMDQSKNIKAYAAYLEERVVSYRDISIDLFRDGAAYMKHLSSLKWQNGLESETKVIQRLIKTLLDCKYYTDSINNDVTTESMKLLVKELMRLFTCLNQAVIVVLQQFFGLSRPDATRALDLYKVFVSQTEKTMEFFDVARRVRYGLGIDVPEIKHAPLSLAKSLEDYIQSPDFEAQRSAYAASKQMASSSNALNNPRPNDNRSASAQTKPTQNQLVDVFSSLDTFQNPPITAPVVYSNQNASTTSVSSLDGFPNQMVVFNAQQQPQQPQQLARQASQMSAPPAQSFSQQAAFSSSSGFYQQQLPQGSYSQPTLPSHYNNDSGNARQLNPFGQPQQQSLFATPQLAAIPQSQNASNASFQSFQQYQSHQQTYGAATFAQQGNYAVAPASNQNMLQTGANPFGQVQNQSFGQGSAQNMNQSMYQQPQNKSYGSLI